MEKRLSSILIGIALVMLFAGIALGYIDNGPKNFSHDVSTSLR